MMHGYSSTQILEGIQSYLEESQVRGKVFILDSSSLTDPSIAHADIILVDPDLSVSVVAGITDSINFVRFIKLVQSTTSKNKTICMPWNVSGDGWSTIIIKQNDNGTPYIFYQDSLGKEIPTSDENLKEALISSNILENDSDIEINIFKFLKDELFNTVPKIHDFSITQQQERPYTGPATILNSAQIIHELRNSIDKSIITGLENKLKSPNFIEKLNGYTNKK